MRGTLLSWGTSVFPHSKQHATVWQVFHIGIKFSYLDSAKIKSYSYLRQHLECFTAIVVSVFSTNQGNLYGMLPAHLLGARSSFPHKSHNWKMQVWEHKDFQHFLLVTKGSPFWQNHWIVGADSYDIQGLSVNYQVYGIPVFTGNLRRLSKLCFYTHMCRHTHKVWAL